MDEPAPPTDESGRCRILLRLFVEVPTLEAALAEAAFLVAALAADVPVRRVGAERYWKIETLFEISLDFGIVQDRAAFAALTGKLATSWGKVGGFPDDLHALWVHGRDAGFMLPSVRFADLQCFSAAEGQAASSPPEPAR